MPPLKSILKIVLLSHCSKSGIGKEVLMIDNVTVRFPDRQIIESSVFQNPSLSQIANIDYQNGDVRTRYANVKNLTFRSTITFTEMHGSLHSFFNVIHRNEARNDDNFPLSHLIESIKLIEEMIKCPAKYIILTSLEFAFNLDLWMNATDFLTGSVILYKYKAPCEDHKNNKKMKILKFIYENFIQKLYDKAKQYSLDKYLLRMETVYKKDIFANFGIFTLQDLCNKDCLIKVFEDYLKRFDRDYLILNSFNGNSNIPDSDRVKILQYTHLDFWTSLNREKNNYAGIYEYRDDFRMLIEMYELDSYKERLRKLLIDKFYTLLES